MRVDIPRLLVALVLATAGVVLFVRATQGGGPIYYFISAVCLGMGFAAFQGRGGQGGGPGRGPGGGQGGRDQTGLKAAQRAKGRGR